MKYTKTIIAVSSALLLSVLFFSVSAAEPNAEKTATFVTYNVLADPDHANQRVPQLLKIIGDSDADIIALQEAAPWFVRQRKEQKARSRPDKIQASKTNQRQYSGRQTVKREDRYFPVRPFWSAGDRYY